MDYVHYTGIWMEGLSKTTKTGFGAKIWTRDFPNTKEVWWALRRDVQ
jgi:hypothetical protein